MELTDNVWSVPPGVRRVAKRLGAACALAMLALAGYWSLRLVWADSLSDASDPETVARAVRLSPGNAGFRVKLARALDKNGGDPAGALEAASLLDPSDAAIWMRLGLNAEMHGSYGRAESDLLEAARVSRRFAPRWALANYYFRRNDPGHFWPWVRQSLEVGNGDDLGPVFKLCWSTTQDAQAILERAIPERRTVLNAYLSFLIQEGRLSAGVPVARQLIAVSTAGDNSTLLNWSDRLLESHDLPAALETWNAMCARRLLPYAPLDPEHGVSLTDGSFDAEAAGGGFGWRIGSVPGVSCGRNAKERYLWFSFSGTQPDCCEPLSEYLALVPATHYRLRFRYRTSDMAVPSGLQWQVQDVESGARLGARSPWLSSPAWKDDEIEFTAASARALARLVLAYQRLPGTPRLEGSVLISRLQLERLP